MATKEKKFECIGGPLCGKKEAPVESKIGVPAFAWEDSDGTTYYYRLARSRGQRYWHFLGSKNLNLLVKPYLRPSP